MGTFQDLTGKRFGRLTVLRPERRLVGKRERIYWVCRCDCGEETSVEASNLTTGHARSCKCLQAESRHTHTRTHGKSGTRTYKIWKGIRKRCLNKNARAYKNYGGRDITICKRWMDYANFLADMGEFPPGYSIDRIDNNRGYFPDNCRWTTDVVQANNTRTNKYIVYKGEKTTLTQLARQHGVPYHRVWARVNLLNWNLDEALK